MRNEKYEDNFTVSQEEYYSEQIRSQEETDRLKDLRQEVKLLEAHGYILENMLACSIIKEHRDIHDELARSLKCLLEAKDCVESDLDSTLEKRLRRNDRWL